MKIKPVKIVKKPSQKWLYCLLFDPSSYLHLTLFKLMGGADLKVILEFYLFYYHRLKKTFEVSLATVMKN